ncbi:MAG: right-handed parallel beta-helix repeat-containing protein [Thermotogota bacterium]
MDRKLRGMLGGAVLAVIAACAVAFGAPVVVPPGGSLQDAIDTAPPGAVLELEAGTYRGSLVIDHSLTLRGVGESTVIDGTKTGAAIHILGNGIAVRLESLTVQGGKGWEGHGIQTEGAPTVELAFVTVAKNSWCGIWSRDRTSLSLDHCRIVENGTHGIYTWDFTRGDLRNCEISRNKTHGILAFHISELRLTDCAVDGNLMGIWAWDGVRVHATRITIIGNVLNGLVAQNGALLDLLDCVVAKNGGLGLWFTDSGRGVLSGCEIRANGDDGVLLEKDGIVEFYGCRIRENAGAGIRASTPNCTGTFAPSAPFKGWVKGAENVVPSPGERGANRETGLCPVYPGSIWPEGFLKSTTP